MFKAIGRWGSNVKGNFNLKFITNLFGTKSKSYNEIESDEEEIFSDAREEPLDLDDEVEEADIILTTHCEPPATSTATVNGSAIGACSDITVTVERSSHSDESSNDEDDGDDEGDGGQSHLTIDNDEGHDHKDSDQILETDSKPSNGIIRNASTSAFKKVHRRISSFTQKQYSKMDDVTDGSEINIEKDPNDNIAGINGATNGKDTGEHKLKSKDEKTRKRNKVPLFKFFRGLIRFPFRSNTSESGTK